MADQLPGWLTWLEPGGGGDGGYYLSNLYTRAEGEPEPEALARMAADLAYLRGEVRRVIGEATQRVVGAAR